MSTILMAACWPLKMSPAQKIVFVALCSHGNEAGYCEPGVSELRQMTCLSERAVRQALRQLERAGLLHREFRPNSTTRYWLNPAAGNAKVGDQ